MPGQKQFIAPDQIYIDILIEVSTWVGLEVSTYTYTYLYQGIEILSENKYVPLLLLYHSYLIIWY